MELVIGIFIFIVALFAFYNYDSTDFIDEYIKKRGWQVISKSRGPGALNFLERYRYYSWWNEHKEDVFYTIVYFDKRNIKHETILKVNLWSKEIKVFQDKIISEYE